MAYCGPRGIAHSEFLAWPIDDQTKALGWLAEDLARCSECGTADWEWEHGPAPYRGEAWVCRGCSALESTQKDNKENARLIPGLKIRLARTEVTDADSRPQGHS